MARGRPLGEDEATVARPSELLDRFFYRPDEDVAGLEGLTAGEAEQPAPVPEEQAVEYLGFRLEGETYAARVASVREIVKVPPLTEVPGGAPHLLGVMNLRGEVMPVYDLKQRLRLAEAAPRVAGPEAPPPPREARVVVLHGGGEPAGVWVDAVGGVVHLKPSSVEAPPRGVAQGERDLVVGLGRRADALYILVDLEAALA